MKLALALFSVIFAHAAFAGSHIIESTVTSPDAAAQKFAHVCVRNYSVDHAIKVTTQWNVGDYADHARLRRGTTMIYRLISPIETKDAKFEILFNNGVQKDDEKQVLDFEWADKP